MPAVHIGVGAIVVFRIGYEKDQYWLAAAAGFTGLLAERIVDGEYHMWMPGMAALNQGTRFLYPTPDATLTIPSTARKIIAVGAYDSRNLS